MRRIHQTACRLFDTAPVWRASVWREPDSKPPVDGVRFQTCGALQPGRIQLQRTPVSHRRSHCHIAVLPDLATTKPEPKTTKPSGNGCPPWP